MITNLPVLRRGARGANVKLLQETLIKAGEDLGRWGADGSFGAQTERAVKSFQGKHNLTQDGIPGPKTYNELKFYAYANFRKAEFACKCGRFCNGHPVEVDEALLVILQNIRDHFKRPVNINSAIRCTTHNRNVGGVTNSQHLTGKAADIRVAGFTPAQVYAYADGIVTRGGVGRYKTFTHIDTRGSRVRFSRL
jgi:uncharacterized protein YcbK (DUF882 family)